MSDDFQRRVVCAAVRCVHGIYIGPRHFDQHMTESIKSQGWFDPEKINTVFFEQGFIDQHGVFMDRFEAKVVADNAYQVIRHCGGDQSQLYSENLY